MKVFYESEIKKIEEKKQRTFKHKSFIGHADANYCKHTNREKKKFATTTNKTADASHARINFAIAADDPTRSNDDLFRNKTKQNKIPLFCI